MILDRLAEWLGRVFPDPATRRPTPGALPRPRPSTHPSLTDFSMADLDPINIAVTHVARRCSAIEGIDSDTTPYLRHCVTLAFTGVTPRLPGPDHDARHRPQQEHSAGCGCASGRVLALHGTASCG